MEQDEFYEKFKNSGTDPCVLCIKSGDCVLQEINGVFPEDYTVEVTFCAEFKGV